MLVLTRKVGEQIVIGNQVTVTVLRRVGNRVTLGVGAPRDVHVVRSELLPIVNAFRDEAEFNFAAETGNEFAVAGA